VTSNKIVDLISKNKGNTITQSKNDRDKAPHLQHYFDQQ